MPTQRPDPAGTTASRQTFEARKYQARRFLQSLRSLPKPQVLSQHPVAYLQDTERLLQILTNAQFVEGKTTHRHLDDQPMHSQQQ